MGAATSRNTGIADRAVRPPDRPSAGWDWTERCLLVALLAAACLGLYGRFVGLGKWSFGVDEYYTSRSIDNVLRAGLPRFLCGGYYTRGLTYQYAVAVLRLAGSAPEFSARLISAASSLIGLPAAYLIGRRLQGRVLGLLMLIVLLASVWEIETARFARMYAPFQSLFLWYVVYFLDYVVERRQAALLPMILLSIIGVLTWEGGALLGVANLLPPLVRHERGRLRRRDWPYIGGMMLLLLVLLAATRDLRGSPPVPPGAHSLEAASPAAIRLYLQHPYWMLIWCLLPVPLALHALAWVWSLRGRWLTAVGLGVALLSALTHQFILCGAAVSLLLLTDLVRMSELRQPAARSCLAALASSAAFWVAFGVVTGAWTDTTPRVGHLSGRWLGLMEHLCGYPDVFGQILRPWGRVMPLLTAAMLLLSGALAVQSIRRRADQSAVPRMLLALSLVLMLAIGTREPGRIETRYAFFLYPLLLALSLAGVLGLTESVLRRGRAAVALGAALSLLLFLFTEDFQPRHAARIDTWKVNFRIGMSAVQAAHYYPRADYRLVAAWLARSARPGDTVMIDIPPIDQYYPRTDFFYLPDGDDRYDDYACGTAGNTERWTNLPLLYGADALAAPVSAGKRIMLLMYPDDARTMLTTARSHNWRASLIWTSPDRGVSVVALNP